MDLGNIWLTIKFINSKNTQKEKDLIILKNKLSAIIQSLNATRKTLWLKLFEEVLMHFILTRILLFQLIILIRSWATLLAAEALMDAEAIIL